jgi:2,5-diketo-D-gluconate reductase A
VTVPNLALNSGRTIPQLGFGVFKIVPAETAAAVSEALRVGYRHIDTAEMYRNEREVGEAVRASGLDRGEVFITSKLNNGFHRPDDARRAFDGTLQALGSDYVDLFLIHWPLPTLHGGDFVSTWLTLEEFYHDGRARSIGVSNFQVGHVRRLVQESGVVPAVNQIEVHPYLCNEEVGPRTPSLGSSPRRGRRSRKAGFSTIRRSARSPVGLAGRPRKWCFGGTFSAGT